MAKEKPTAKRAEDESTPQHKKTKTFNNIGLLKHGVPVTVS